MANGQTWHNLKGEKGEKIRNYLLKAGGRGEKINNENELWRISFSTSLFTYYQNGTLYCTPPAPSDQNTLSVWSVIEKITGPRYEPPEREFLFGLDETGKGEIIGPVILVGVIFPQELFATIDSIIGLANTKKRHPLGYWEKIFGQLGELQEKGVSYIREEISPNQLFGMNLNRLLDKGYRKIINQFLKGSLKEGESLARYRIVIDDYGVGERMELFLRSLKKKGGEVIITPNADEKYLEVKAAAIIAKRFRERIIKRIKENPQYQIGGLTIGSGNSADKETKEWLKKWWETYKNFPWFVKKSFKTIKRL
ncbi:MAG: hypothetical protein ABIK81_01260 [candidate division WOR-3 bacterium]